MGSLYGFTPKAAAKALLLCCALAGCCVLGEPTHRGALRTAENATVWCKDIDDCKAAVREAIAVRRQKETATAAKLHRVKVIAEEYVKAERELHSLPTKQREASQSLQAQRQHQKSLEEALRVLHLREAEARRRCQQAPLECVSLQWTDRWRQLLEKMRSCPQQVLWALVGGSIAIVLILQLTPQQKAIGFQVSSSILLAALGASFAADLVVAKLAGGWGEGVTFGGSSQEAFFVAWAAALGVFGLTLSFLSRSASSFDLLVASGLGLLQGCALSIVLPSFMQPLLAASACFLAAMTSLSAGLNTIRVLEGEETVPSRQDRSFAVRELGFSAALSIVLVSSLGFCLFKLPFLGQLVTPAGYYLSLTDVALSLLPFTAQDEPPLHWVSVCALRLFWCLLTGPAWARLARECQDALAADSDELEQDLEKGFKQTSRDGYRPPVATIHEEDGCESESDAGLASVPPNDIIEFLGELKSSLRTLREALEPVQEALRQEEEEEEQQQCERRSSRASNNNMKNNSSSSSSSSSTNISNNKKNNNDSNNTCTDGMGASRSSASRSSASAPASASASACVARPKKAADKEEQEEQEEEEEEKEAAAKKDGEERKVEEGKREKGEVVVEGAEHAPESFAAV